MSRSNTQIFRLTAIASWVCGLAATVLVIPRVARAQALDHDAMLKVQREQRDMQYKRMQTMVTSFPGLTAKEVSEILQLKMDCGNLSLTTPLLDPSHDTGGFRVTCDQFKGPTYVTVSPMGMPVALGGGAKAVAKAGAAANPNPPRVFCFNSYELPNPDELVTLTIQFYGQRLQIDRQVRSGAGGFRRVMLVQQRSTVPGASDPGQSLVQLNVNEFGDTAPGGIPRNFSAQAPDFQTLLRDHGREAEQYIRPLFRDLGQEAALAPDGRIAWQVLADHWQPDPELARKIQLLLPTLNDLDFHSRDKALAELEEMGMQGATVLLHLDRMGLTPEQNLMIDRTLAPFSQLSHRDAARLHSDTEFLIDCLYIANSDVRAAALDRLKQVAGKDVSFDLNASEAARLSAVTELRKKLAAKPAETPSTNPAKS